MRLDATPTDLASVIPAEIPDCGDKIKAASVIGCTRCAQPLTLGGHPVH
jgi:hypothetical protein